jgi:hypothetical protein
VFVTSLEEFEKELKHVGWITFGAVVFGLLGRGIGQSVTATQLTFLSMGLCVNWFFGYVFSYRTRKDLANINFRNLNGCINFEALMVFAQLQILVLVGTFIFGFTKLVSLIIELKEL